MKQDRPDSEPWTYTVRKGNNEYQRTGEHIKPISSKVKTHDFQGQPMSLPNAATPETIRTKPIIALAVHQSPAIAEPPEVKQPDTSPLAQTT